MRMYIEIDDELLSDAMAAAGLATKRATLEEGLHLLVRVRRKTEALEDLKGLGWEGNRDARGPFPPPAVILVDTLSGSPTCAAIERRRPPNWKWRQCGNHC